MNSGMKRTNERRSGPAASAGAGHGEDLERLRLLVRIALMYHQRGLSQPRIASHLGLSQARVSQLLQAAAEEGIVETTVHVPDGMFSDVEAALEERYGVREVVVVDLGPGSAREERRALGLAAAPRVQRALEGQDVIGVSAWSETLVEMVEVMKPSLARARYVVNTFGGFGPASSQMNARLTERLARLCRARPVYVLGPGVVSSRAALAALRRERWFREVSSLYERLTLLLVGIGGAVPSRVVLDSGYMDDRDKAELRRRGAVGDICLQYFDARGRPVRTSVTQRILGIGLEQVRGARTLAVAGGRGKFLAVRGALRGGWLDALVTDLATAQRLLREP